MSASPAPVQAPAPWRDRAAPRLEDSRRVDEDELGVLLGGDAAQQVRVVCTLWETIVTLAPTIALIRVDLPTLGHRSAR